MIKIKEHRYYMLKNGGVLNANEVYISHRPFVIKCKKLSTLYRQLLKKFKKLNTIVQFENSEIVDYGNCFFLSVELYDDRVHRSRMFPAIQLMKVNEEDHLK